jgi:hypothetical protein
MPIPIFNPEQKTKLTYLINEGVSVMTEVQTLNEGLNDTIKAIAEELVVKPSVLKKAVRTAFKQNFHQAQDDHELLETILETVGKTE